MDKEQHFLASLVNTRKSSIAREQISLASFLNALTFIHTEADKEQFRTQTCKQTIAVPIIFSLVCLYITAETAFDMVHHIQVHDWLHAVSDLFSPLANWFLFLMLFIAFKSMQASSPLAQNVLELRQRLNDKTLIPPLAEQPSAFENGVFSFEPTRIGPVRRAKGFVILGIGLGIFFSLITMFFAAMIAALLPWIQGPNAATNFWAAFALSTLLLFCLAFAIMLFILALRMAHASKVTVDEWGLRWTWPNLIKGRSVAMAWHEITGFYEVTGQENKGDAAKTYVLDSPTSTFIWSLKKNSTEEELQANDKLARLIITRTNLPLRDLTAAVEPFLNSLPKEKEAAATRPGVI